MSYTAPRMLSLCKNSLVLPAGQYAIIDPVYVLDAQELSEVIHDFMRDRSSVFITRGRVAMFVWATRHGDGEFALQLARHGLTVAKAQSHEGLLCVVPARFARDAPGAFYNLVAPATPTETSGDLRHGPFAVCTGEAPVAQAC